jgi:hypothetical protein
MLVHLFNKQNVLLKFKILCIDHLLNFTLQPFPRIPQ